MIIMARITVLVKMIWLLILCQIVAANEDNFSSAYFITRENRRLAGHLVKKIESTSFMACSHSCLRHSWCTSTNFKESIGQGDKGTCEMNKHEFVPINDETKLIDQPGTTFTMMLKGCLMTGCLNGGSCLFDKKKETFTCSCKLPWIGDKCEVKTERDIDKCESISSHNCPPNSKCVNVPGSFRCDCDPGFTNDGAMCKECQNALGMENGHISDVQISASSEYHPKENHAANQGRLHFTSDGVKAGAWAAGTNDNNQWLQIDLGSKHTRITGVATQGRNGKCCQQWVTKYKLQYSDHTMNFQYYKEKGQTSEKEFTGNTDTDTVARQNLSTPIKARYIRFRPVEWRVHISMRGELYGCYENWKKINDDPVCFGARDESYGAFNISQSGLIYTFKLVRRSGALRCSNYRRPSYWGCTHNSYGDMTLATVITYPNKTALPLAKYKESGNGCVYYLYKIDGVGVNATELVFNNLPSPMTVSTGQEFQIWFGEDLTDCSEENNSGQTCADVYAWYT